MTNKELRLEKRLTQVQAAELTGIPIRTYKLYENDPSKAGTIKYNYITNILTQYGVIDEDHGILSMEDIQTSVKKVLQKYDAEYVILFGSYAKGNARENSDVDLLVSTKITGIKFYGIAEALRMELRKKIDLLDLAQLMNNKELLYNILMVGQRIYVQD